MTYEKRYSNYKLLIKPPKFYEKYNPVLGSDAFGIEYDFSTNIFVGIKKGCGCLV
jgi:hypothetical protein